MRHIAVIRLLVLFAIVTVLAIVFTSNGRDSVYTAGETSTPAPARYPAASPEPSCSLTTPIPTETPYKTPAVDPELVAGTYEVVYMGWSEGDYVHVDFIYDGIYRDMVSLHLYDKFEKLKKYDMVYIRVELAELQYDIDTAFTQMTIVGIEKVH